MTRTELAIALRSLRSKFGWTQEEAALRIGIPLRTWQAWESNRGGKDSRATLIAWLIDQILHPPKRQSQDEMISWAIEKLRS